MQLSMTRKCSHYENLKKIDFDLGKLLEYL